MVGWYLRFLILKRVVIDIMLGFVSRPVAPQAQSTELQSLGCDGVFDAAKKEGKVNVSISASIEFRKQPADNFKRRGGAGVRHMADEFKAGLRYLDLHMAEPVLVD